MELTKKQLEDMIFKEDDAKDLLERQCDFLDTDDFQYSGVVSLAGGDMYGRLLNIIPFGYRQLYNRLCEDLFLKGYKRALRDACGVSEYNLEKLLKEIRKKKCQKKQSK